MYTNHGHWFSASGEPDPMTSTIKVKCGGLSMCPECARHLGRTGGMILGQVPELLGVQPAAPVDAPPGSIQLDAISDWVDRYKELKAAESKIKEMLAEARDRILDQVQRHQDHGGPQLIDAPLTVRGVPVLHWQTVTQSRVDTTRLKRDRPEVAEQFMVTSSHEKITIK